jgi:hypothetical protein
MACAFYDGRAHPLGHDCQGFANHLASIAASADTEDRHR